MDEPTVNVDDGKTRTVSHAPEFCDACSGTGAKVEAFVFAELPSGRSVAYCAHHGGKYWDKLNEQALVVIDYRHMAGSA